MGNFSLAMLKASLNSFKFYVIPKYVSNQDYSMHTYQFNYTSVINFTRHLASMWLF